MKYNCSEPSIRGVLMAFSGISSAAGTFMVFLFGTFCEWRQVALYCSFVPMLTLFGVFFVMVEPTNYRKMWLNYFLKFGLLFQIPETPIWLLSKKRPIAAVKALCWLRGWVPPQAISIEFKTMQQYNAISNGCIHCQKHAKICAHAAPNFQGKLKDILRKRTIKPFILITVLYILMEFCGMFAMRPYIVQILNSYSVPIRTNVTTLYLGLIGLIANIMLVFTMKLLGKRKIYLISMAGNVFCCIVLGVWIVYLFININRKFQIRSLSSDRCVRIYEISTWDDIFSKFCI